MKKLPENYKKILRNVFNDNETLHIDTIYGGGSKRKYLRIKNNKDSFILCQSEKLEEVDDHIEVSMFFEKKHIPVPKIYGYIKEEGLILFEDIGSISLEKKVKNSKEILETYKSVIDILIRLQNLNPEICPPIRNKIFDKEYYRWETTYFIESCVEKVFNLKIKNRVKLNKEFDELAESLSKKNPFIVHRDFQSQNIYIKNGNIVFLDFQGARKGAREYDLASLLYDPYVDIGDERRRELLKYYYHKTAPKESFDDFLRTFHRVSMQRLMQALGAYGFISLVNKKPFFLKHIEPAGLRLYKICKKYPEFPEITGICEKIISMDIENAAR